MQPRPIAFHARPPWFGGTLQTLRGIRFPLPVPLTQAYPLWLPLPDGDALAARLHWPRQGRQPPRPLALLVHGLCGMADDTYLREAGAGLLRRGFPVLRLNLRGNMVSRPRSSSHYHLGRAEDLASVLKALPEALVAPGVVVAGWSLGGALVLQLLARHAQEAGMPRLLAGAAICAPLQPELAHRAIDAHPLFGPLLLRLYRREVLSVAATDLTPALRRAAREARSVQEFEATVTAPRFGFPSYEVFIELNRPADALPRLRVPTLLAMAADDPIVPIASLDGIDWDACPAVAPLVFTGGGHCGFHDWRRENAATRALCAFFAGAAAGAAVRTPAVARNPS